MIGTGVIGTGRIERSLITGLFVLALLGAPFASPASEHIAPASSVSRETEVETVRMPSAAMDRTMRALVMLPPSYHEKPGKKFPVIYLLHCAAGYPEMYVQETALAEMLADRNMIVVCPEATPFGWYVNSPVSESLQVERFLVSELIPRIDKDYRTIAGREGRALSGFSMGGHGAVTLAAKYPDLFASASSQGGIFDPTRWDGHWELADAFGPLEEMRSFWVANSAMGLAGRFASEAGAVALLIECGTEDFAIAENREFRERLKNLGVEHVYREFPGGHDFLAYSGRLDQHLDFHIEAVAEKSVFRPVHGGNYRDMIAAHRGRIVAVYFWATWCAPCVKGFPKVVELDGKYKAEDLVVIGVSVDFPGDEKKAVGFLEEQRAGFDNLLVQAEDINEFIKSVSPAWAGDIPAVFIYDRSGELVAQYFGEDAVDMAGKTLDQLLQQN